MKILIIGGTGLISTWITRRLLAQGGHELTLYNRGKTEAPLPAQAKTLLGDRTDYPTFEAQMAEIGPFDSVIDMVGYAPEDAHSVVRAFKGRVGQFIFCSTIDVYSKPAHRLPYLEDEPYGGLNTYSRHKVIMEKTLREAHDSRTFPVTIIRPAYTYGESRGPIHSLGGSLTYLDRVRRGKPIVVHGDGTSLWGACHADDVAGAFVGAIGNPVTFGKAYHATGEEWLTWNQYHQGVAEALNVPTPPFVHIPSELLAVIAPKRAGICLENFQFDNIFDNSAAHRDLGFRYTTRWIEGVRRMAAWLDERHRIPNSDSDPLEDQIIAAWRSAESAMKQAMPADTISA